jgi:thymidylate synthase (FAD)
MSLKQIEVKLQDWMGDDRAIVEAAWTSSYSYAKREEKLTSQEDVERVIRTVLAEQGHGVPFEHVLFRFWIKMPLFTDRQHMTHRIASHSGLSGRWRTVPTEWYRLPDDIQGILYRDDYTEKIIDQYEELCEHAYSFYNGVLGQFKKREKSGKITNAEYKRIREIIRGVLPQAGMTERTTTMNLRSFANYQKLRNSDHAQPEMRRVAELMLQEVKAANVCPVAISALESKGWAL